MLTRVICCCNIFHFSQAPLLLFSCFHITALNPHMLLSLGWVTSFCNILLNDQILGFSHIDEPQWCTWGCRQACYVLLPVPLRGKSVPSWYLARCPIADFSDGRRFMISAFAEWLSIDQPMGKSLTGCTMLETVDICREQCRERVSDLRHVARVTDKWRHFSNKGLIIITAQRELIPIWSGHAGKSCLKWWNGPSFPCSLTCFVCWFAGAGKVELVEKYHSLRGVHGRVDLGPNPEREILLREWSLLSKFLNLIPR